MSVQARDSLPPTNAILQALADKAAEGYGWRALQQQRQGRGEGPVQRRRSVVDALPARLAAQQLSRVQQAILQSQRAFERQAEAVEQAVLARSFYVS